MFQIKSDTKNSQILINTTVETLKLRVDQRGNSFLIKPGKQTIFSLFSPTI